jgi:hypothetical protein
MTLSRHVQLLKIGIAFSALALAGVAAISWKIMPLFPYLVKTAQNRSLLPLLRDFLPAQTTYTPFVTVVAAIIYALITLIIIFYMFEKTQSVEVHFLILFVFSLVFEVARLGIPVRLAFNISGILLTLVARLLVFFRYFGMFSLFIASLYSAGLKIEKEENVLFPLVVITLFLSISLPINTFTFDTTLCLANGYPIVFRVMEYLVAGLSALSFVYGAWKASVKEYYFIGFGTLLAFTGRGILIDADFYAMAAVGFVLLSGGTCLICYHLRKLYLWA